MQKIQIIIRKVSGKIAFTMLGLVLILNCDSSAQNALPYHYWTFEGNNPLDDSMNHYNLNPGANNSPYAINTNPQTTAVGNCLNISTAAKIITASSSFTLDSGVTIEFLYKPAANNENQTVQLFSRRDGAFQIRIGFPNIKFSTNVIPTGSTTAVNDNFNIDLTGVGRGSFGYYVDGNWHHFVFKYNAKTGKKEIWVDGQLPAGFSTTVAPGKFATNTTNPNNNIVDMNTNTEYYKINGDLDEIAIYKFALNENIIYKHYNEFKQKQHYTFSSSSIVPPAAAQITAGINPMEYAPGHPNVTVSALDQIKAFPNPRYKPNNTLFPNIPLLNPGHLAGLNQQPIVPATTIRNVAREMQLQFVKTFNYTLVVSSNTGHGKFTDTTTLDGSWIKLANENPQWKTSAVAYWDQIRPDKTGFTSRNPYINCGCLPASSYLKNSLGQFIDRNGNVTPYKVLNPETASWDSINQDGLVQRTYMTNLTNALTRPLDVFMEDGEVITHWTPAGLAKDPIALAGKVASGLDWEQYIGKKYAKLTSIYMDQFRSIPKLANTHVSLYQVTAHPANWDWHETRTLNSLRKGMRYSSADIYLQSPFAWLDGFGNTKGWEDVIDQRYVEIGTGDKFYSPVVSPGWSFDEEKTLRPAQWLGFLKAVALTGVENFNTGYFSLLIPAQQPKNYIWQLSIPAYVQSLISRYEDLLWNGHLMDGDVVAHPGAQPAAPGYSFSTGDVRKLVVARKHNTLSKYVVTGTIQNNSNMTGNAELEGMASINLDGQNLKFNIRRQGSTYMYDKTNPSAPVFYQLDDWHENIHPYYWSKTFELEAELFDNNATNVNIKTEVPAGTTSGNFTNFTSFITFNSISNVEYNIQPRGNSTATHYLWVLARSVDGTNTGFNVTLDGGPVSTNTCVTDQNWRWYQFESSTGLPISFTNLSLDNHTISISNINNKLQIDRVTVTNQSGAFYPNGVAPCNVVTAIANITPLGATTFCQGNSVTLSANTGTAYVWSTGATTKNINVTTAGTYTVEVFNGVTSALSSPVLVTVNARPLTGITASGPLTFCIGGSVTLTANEANATYSWSPGGATTRSVTVSNSGNYSLVLTNAASCTAVSQPVTVTAAASTNVPSIITPNGATTFCEGGTVGLTANSGTGYLWSTGETTQLINVTTSGNYTVKVINSGCPSLPSPVTTVTVNHRPTFTLTASGPLSFCNGGSVTLNAVNSTGNRYVWYKNSKSIPSAGVLSPSLIVTEPGTYAVRVQLNNCARFSQAIVVTVPCREGETFGINGFDAMAYPNPFEDKIIISVSLVQAQKVTIKIYDLNGRLVSNVAEGYEAPEGKTEFKYENPDLGKAIYYAIITTGTESKRIKIASLK